MEEIKSILEDHERRIAALEKSISQPREHTIKKDKKTLSDYIIELREGGFFSKPQTADNTHKKLQGTYSCELNRVRVAILRIANKRQLRKATVTIAGKKYKAYVW